MTSIADKNPLLEWSQASNLLSHNLLALTILNKNNVYLQIKQSRLHDRLCVFDRLNNRLLSLFKPRLENKRPFGNQTDSNYLSTGLVGYSDPHFTALAEELGSPRKMCLGKFEIQ